MPQRELKAHAPAIIRRVQDDQAHYIITYRGRPVSLLTPFPQTALETQLFDQPSGAAPWEELTTLGEQIGAGWQSSQSSAEILSGMRR